MHDKTDAARRLSPAEARSLIRSGQWHDLSEAVAHEYVHVAPVFVPEAIAGPFLEFCRRNPLAAPVVDVLPVGTWESRLAPGADVRTDVVRYQVWEHGQLTAEVPDLRSYWRDDLVTVLLGTSHILGVGLLAGGVPVTVVDNPRPAIYRTTNPAPPSPPFAADLHVTVKFAPPDLVDRVIAISGQYPAGHGAPVHTGDPAAFGVIGDRPAFGAPLEVPLGTVPIFWACSFTALAALRALPADWFACSAPGCSFITDEPILSGATAR